MDKKVYIFSEEEFLLLAAAGGIREMYGFKMKKVETESAALLCSMQKLASRGLLCVRNEKFYLTEASESIFSQIKEAKTTMEIHKQSGKKCIIYIGDHAVRISYSKQRKNKMEVQCISADKIWDFLQEEGWITVCGKEKEDNFDFGGY